MAKRGVIAFGIILLLIGVFMVIVGTNLQLTYSHVTSSNAFVYQKRTEAITIQIVGGILALLGFTAIIGGAAAGSKSKSTIPLQIIQTQTQTVQPVQTPSVSGTEIEYCYHCGGSMPTGSQFCKKCGRSQSKNPPNIQQQSPTTPTIHSCPNCGKKLTYIYSSQNWFCGTCEKHFA